MSYLVILDPGHGLSTYPGKRTPLFPDSSYMRENEFNRAVTMKVYNILEKYEDIDVIFTTTEKRDIELSERVTRVNDLYRKVKDLYDNVVLVSIHANALTGSWGVQNGTETFYYKTNEKDKEFAAIIHKNLVDKTKLFDRGVKGAEFYIIKNVGMTACLVECAFMDNLEEAKLLLSDEFRQDCAVGIVNGLLEYFGGKVEYKKYKDGTHELKGNPLDLKVKIVNKSNKSITEDNSVNGTFFWYVDENRTITYPTSILIIDGLINKNEANHFSKPQSVFIIYNDGNIEMKRVKYATELNYKNIKLAIGGLGLRNTLDSTFKYNPIVEGFSGVYADVLRKTNKTVIGYNKKHNKVYLLTKQNITHGDLIKLISDNSTGEAYDIALSLDGGGSTFTKVNGSYVLNGDGRRINNILYFSELEV